MKLLTTCPRKTTKVVWFLSCTRFLYVLKSVVKPHVVVINPATKPETQQCYWAAVAVWSVLEQLKGDGVHPRKNVRQPFGQSGISQSSEEEDMTHYC
ncbi:jg26127 [Pararge aegeria aegeria]|uniref:Jg26127 protein n=1 Tax=Pararge aegeria aegeria TaxID=348720 RepID=A0A8S4S2P7_9NEOP|nr:jg26127 [Pararge aegeria aegeria]